jgi:hypothetical protein
VGSIRRDDRKKLSGSHIKKAILQLGNGQRRYGANYPSSRTNLASQRVCLVLVNGSARRDLNIAKCAIFLLKDARLVSVAQRDQ